jgi:hypothetical protein
MSQGLIDLDAETILFEGKPHSRSDLAQRIKSMLDSGDFAISRPSQVLEQLNLTLASLRTVAFRATPELADALNAQAARLGRSPAQVIRDALHAALDMPATPEPPFGRGGQDLPEPQVREAARPTPAEGISRLISSAPEPARVTPREGTARLTSPAPAQVAAAVRAAPPESLPSVVVDGAVAAVPSTPAGSSPAKEEEEAVERRWFGS